MTFPRHLISLAFPLLLLGSSVYSVDLVNAAQQRHSAHTKKPVLFHYVCPMHDKVTSKTHGICRICK